MVLLLSIILIILGFIILALKGFFGIFPDNWEWVGIVLAGIGLLMAIPSALQMLAGKPKLLAYFRNEPGGLVIMLKNIPLRKGGIWHRLGIRRDSIESLEVSFELSESGSGTVKQPIIHTTIYDHADGAKKNRVTLPPTFSVGAGIEVVYWDSNKKVATLVGDAQRQPLQLERGKYCIKFSFLIDGIPINKSTDFVVGENVMWVLPNPDREDYRIQ